MADGSVQKSQHTKRERLKTVGPQTDASALAQKVVENCKCVRERRRHRRRAAARRGVLRASEAEPLAARGSTA